jgi:hypothetical protein
MIPVALWQSPTPERITCESESSAYKKQQRRKRRSYIGELTRAIKGLLVPCLGFILGHFQAIFVLICQYSTGCCPNRLITDSSLPHHYFSSQNIAY